MPQPTIKGNALPRNGTYPAIVHLVSSERTLKIRFDVQVNGAVIPVDCPVNLQSEKGRGFLSRVRRAAGLGSSADDQQMDGRQVRVVCCVVIAKGAMRWKIREVLGAHTPTSIADNQESEVEPDNLDELADRMLGHMPEALFAREGDIVLLIRPGHTPVRIDPKCDDYAKLQHELTGLGTVETDGRILAQRFRLKALDNTMNFRRGFFSLAKSDQVLIPVEGGDLLRITPNGFDLVDNGWDGVWLAHPKSQPMPWLPGLDPRDGLALLEAMIVETFAIPNRALRYLLMAAALLFPWVRQLTRMRPLVQLNGGDGAGKSTNSQRFLTLFRLGTVKGDYSVPKLQRDGDQGLIVLDNVESSDLTKLLNNYLLFAAGNSEWGRVGEQPSTERPVLIVSSIEGIGVTSEAARRLLTFLLERDKAQPFEEEKLLAEIEDARPIIFRAICEVLLVFLSQEPVPVPKLIPMPDFTDYCHIIYRLLCAFGKSMRKPEDFADGVFEAWAAERRAVSQEAPDSAGPYPRLLEASLSRDELPLGFDKVREYRFKDLKGDLYLATGTAWLTLLNVTLARERSSVKLPENSEGLRNRFKALKPEHGFVFVTDKEDPNSPKLKRGANRRPWGILWIKSEGDSLSV